MADKCPAGTTLMCLQKFGREETCSCEPQQTLEDMVDPPDY